MLTDQKAVIRLSDELKSELSTLVVLGTLAVVNLRADYYNSIVATDASGDCLAAVTADCPEPVVEEVARHSLKKGIWTKLLPGTLARERIHGLLDPDGEVPGLSYRTHPLWDLLARCLQYKCAWRELVRRPMHINLLELKAYLKHERRIATRTRSKRVLFGMDSQVSLGAVVKGRSSSKALNGELKKSVAPAIGADIYGLYMYYDTKFNPADDPTRSVQTREPDLALPHWWHEVCGGSFVGFDQWLLAHGAAADLAGVDFGELCSAEGVDLRPQRSRRREPQLQREDAELALEEHLVRERKRASEHGIASSSRGVRIDSITELLMSFPLQQFVFSGTAPDFSSPGALDLFSGRAGVAKQMVRLGCPWVLTFDWKRDVSEDLLDEGLRRKIETLLKSGRVLAFGAAPICASFSVAVTPPVRSAQHPRGKPGLRHSMREKVSQGNSHNDWLADIIAVCEEYHVIWWVENPDTSWWWRQRRWRRFRSSFSKHVFRLCFCRFEACGASHDVSVCWSSRSASRHVQAETYSMDSSR